MYIEFTIIDTNEKRDALNPLFILNLPLLNKKCFT